MSAYISTSGAQLGMRCLRTEEVYIVMTSSRGENQGVDVKNLPRNGKNIRLCKSCR